ncbi:MAG: hypothetical protein ACREN8_11975, partial [Candidatus Dormibacteraceae bacterium]
MISPLLLLVVLVFVGFGLTYFCGLSLRFEERLAYGAVIAPILFSLVTLRDELTEVMRSWREFEPLPLWILLAAAWPVWLILMSNVYHFSSNGLSLEDWRVRSDWAAHLTYASS